MSESEPTSLVYAVKSTWSHRRLVVQLIRRDIQSRYKSSVLGLAWTVLVPLLMLAAYTFTFQTVLGARWGRGTENVTDFALVLFLGMIVFNLFAECLTRAPALIVTQPNYVTKIVFPLHLMPLVMVGSAFFQMCISWLVWFTFALFFGQVSWGTALLWPLILVPFLIGLVALGWLLSSLGVYLRDLNQGVTVLATALMFLSPLFFPVSAMPSQWRWLLNINPLTYFIEQTRACLMWGQGLDTMQYLFWLAGSCVFAAACFWWFQKARKGFADVI
jgi:lipopolysaccharide transport system permease protein